MNSASASKISSVPMPFLLYLSALSWQCDLLPERWQAKPEIGLREINLHPSLLGKRLARQSYGRAQDWSR